MKIIFWIVLFFLLTSLWGFYITIRPPRFISRLTPKDLGLCYEEVTFPTADGLKLAGWFIGNPASSETIILLHGYPADKGDILPAFSFLAKKYNLFFFDFRYLGRSEGWFSTVGARETEDLLAAIKYLKSRGIKEVGVWGFSMGGAVALMTAERAPEIKAIVSEASYSRLDLLAASLYRLPILKYPLGWLTRLWAKLFLGIEVKKISPIDSARRLNIPVLIIHSTDDRVIPFSHALMLKEALKNNAKAEFWFQDNLVHGQLPPEYQKRLSDFFERNF
jgi:dipeptidyl aminopeptidase/acylaminoacyl peptidase